MGPGWAASIKGSPTSSIHLLLPYKNDSLGKFREIDDYNLKKPVLSPEEKTLVQRFEPSHSKDSHCRFIVPLPWKSGLKEGTFQKFTEVVDEYFQMNRG